MNASVISTIAETPDDKIIAEYIWLGATPTDIRSKSRTITHPKEQDPPTVAELPAWNYDGSSTEQAPGDNSEVILQPRRVFPDPLRRGRHILVVCDTYTPQGDPLPSNTRCPAKHIFDRAPEAEPWFGLEQEYTIFEPDTTTPHGWPGRGHFPAPQGPYYCGVGCNHTPARAVSEAHYRACLAAGISISGTNAEVMLGQWEYQVGPVEGIDSGDQMTASRYLLHRIGELFGVVISLDPKPIEGDWNGAGCHMNFSTAAMRQSGGYEAIMDTVQRLAAAHDDHIAVYGIGNDRRLTGRHETASIDAFSWGVADRGASVRIPSDTARNQCGYLEDRRPASNADPYVITSKMFATSLGETE